MEKVLVVSLVEDLSLDLSELEEFNELDLETCIKVEAIFLSEREIEEFENFIKNKSSKTLTETMAKKLSKLLGVILMLLEAKEEEITRIDNLKKRYYSSL